MNVQEIKKAPRPRYSGILVHPTSFPSPYGIGDLGDSALGSINNSVLKNNTLLSNHNFILPYILFQN